MSSTYLHYSASTSLPSDYAILSRYNASRSGTVPFMEGREGDDPTSGDVSDSDFLTVTTNLNRRQSMPSGSHPAKPRPRPTMAQPRPIPVPATENTPLLETHIPRIEEEGDVYGGQVEPETSSIKKYLKECFIMFKYTLPVFGTHLLEYSLVSASVVSIGHISTTALAASTLGSMTASVSGYSILQGFANTLDTVLPSAWTSEHPKLVGLWAQRMTVVLAATLIPICAVWANAEAILLLLRQDPEVAHLAALYLRWALLGLPAYAFNQVSRRYFQAQGLFTVPTRIILAVAPLNVLLNYLLVWGPEPIRLGFIGAPIASAISFNLMAIFAIAYGIFWAPKKAWYPLSRRMFTSLGILVQLGVAGVGQTASEWWSWELIGLAASQLGPVALATQSVLLVSASTTYQAPYSLSVAASVRIGNLLGEKNAYGAGVASKASMLLTLVISGINSSIYLIFRDSWGRIFNDDDEVISLVSSILPLVALFQIFDGLCACTAGILRARGKQAVGALLNLSAYYILGIPFGLWLAFSETTHMNLIGLWYGLTTALVYCAAVGIWLCLKTDWDREVDKVLERMEKERVEDERMRLGSNRA